MNQQCPICGIAMQLIGRDRSWNGMGYTCVECSDKYRVRTIISRYNGNMIVRHTIGNTRDIYPIEA